MLTLILAVWGAALGTLTAAWNIDRDYTNKGRLRVHCYIGWIAGGGEVDRTDRLVYSVTNVGRQPVMVTHLGGHSVGGDRYAFMIIPHDGTVPRMLAPGEYLLDYTEDLSVFDQQAASRPAPLPARTSPPEPAPSRSTSATR